MISTVTLRQAVRQGRLPRYARPQCTRTLTTEKAYNVLQGEAHTFLGIPQQVVSPAPEQPVPHDDMHHHLPPDKHPMLQLIATYIMSKKVCNKPERHQ